MDEIYGLYPKPERPSDVIPFDVPLFNIDEMFDASKFVDTSNEHLSYAFVSCIVINGDNPKIAIACAALINQRFVVSLLLSFNTRIFIHYTILFM